LGSVELHVSELARESGDARYLYESTGPKTAADPLRLDKGNVYKGNLHYTASFIPALALKGVQFDSQPNEIQKAAESNSRDEDGGDAGDSGSIISSSSYDHGPIPITIKSPPPKETTLPKGGRSASKSVESVNTTGTNDSIHTAETSASKATKGVDGEGVEMSTEELLAQRESFSATSQVRCANAATVSRIWYHRL
jgi:hypothetical protein